MEFLKEYKSAGDIRAPVAKRILDGLANGLPAREVNDRVIGRSVDSGFENGPHGFPISDVRMSKARLDPGQALQTCKHLGMCILERIEDAHLMTLGDQFDDGMAADVAGASGDENVDGPVLAIRGGAARSIGPASMEIAGACAELADAPGMVGHMSGDHVDDRALALEHALNKKQAATEDRAAETFED